jgi:hypothetical protein
MIEAAPAFLYLGCAALLMAAVLLRLSAKARAGFFIAMILAATTGGSGPQARHVPMAIIAMI